MLFGRSATHTLPDVFRELHDERQHRWSRQWTIDQKNYRRYWESRLGDMPCIGLSPRGVTRIVEIDAKKNGWSDRTIRGYLRYMKEAMAYAQTQLKWIEERHNGGPWHHDAERDSAVTLSRSEMQELVGGTDAARRDGDQ